MASVSEEERPEVQRAREWISTGGRLRSTIHRVPPEILLCNQNAYEHFYQPKAVCIGPYFYSSRDEKGLKSMQDYKWVCMLKLTSIYGTINLFERCKQKMMELEGRVRESYSEDISWLNSEDLAVMMTVDGCFILHVLLNEEFCEDDCRKIIGRFWIWELVMYDLLLLENQIPFFVIQELYQILKTRDCNSINLVKCALRYFKNLDPWKKERSAVSVCALRADDVHHLLHLTYKLFLPRSHLVNFSEPKSSQQWIRSATELQAVGVKFKKREDASSFFDIEFSKRVLQIPPLEVHDYSESLFRNLIAFEQSYPDNDFLVTAYATFMNCLVVTQEDLTSLRLNGILAFRMTGDKDTVHFFSRLCNDVHWPKNKNYLDGVFGDVTAYTDSRWGRCHSHIVRNYFKSPWTIFSLYNGIAIFVLTYIQTFFPRSSK